MTTQDFPRGGQQALSALEYRDIADKAKSDVLFMDTTEDGTTKKRKATEEELEDEEISKKSKPLHMAVGMLSLRKISVGMMLVGVVKEVNELEIRVALPNQLMGTVSITEISAQITTLVALVADAEEDDEEQYELPDLDKYFQVGKPVVVKVLSTGDQTSKKIDLSLLPERLNGHLSKANIVQGLTITGSVVSKEDHGYVMSLGMEGSLNCFLPTKECSKEYLVGELVHGVVTKATSKVVQLSALYETVASSCIASTSSLEMDGILAGSQVHGKVSSLSQGGLRVTILGIFEADLEASHCKKSYELEAKYKLGMKVKCRVLWVDTSAKTIGLSMAEHLVGWKSVSCPIIIGEISEVVVRRVDEKVGLLVEWSEDVLGYVHISKIKDDRIASIDSNYHPETIHKARVTGFDFCNNLLLISLQPRVLLQAFVRLEDIVAGTILKGVVDKIEGFGMLVAVTDSIKGLCPNMHLSDAQLTNPEKMFKIGSTMSFRVLSVDVEKRRLILTLKKSLVQCKTKLFLEYHDVKAGDVTTGVIGSVKDYGCIINFFNNLRALAPLSELSHEHLTNPASHFRVGQSVKCQVISVDPEDMKMRVTLKVSQIQDGDQNTVSEGFFVSANAQGIVVRVVGSSNTISIPMAHLSDHISAGERLFKALSMLKGFKDVSMGAVVVREVDVAKGVIRGSMKMLMMEEMNTITVGEVYGGVVKNVTEKLCFVELGGITTVANVHNIADGFVTDARECVKVGQSVLACVTRMEEESGRIFVSLKPSMVKNEAGRKGEATFLKGLFITRRLITLASKKALEWTKKYLIGSRVFGVVEQIVGGGAIVKFLSKVTGLIGTVGVEIDVGCGVECVVLDVDTTSKILDLRFVQISSAVSGDSGSLLEANKAIETEKRVEGIVEVVKEDYCVVRMDGLDTVGFCLNRAVNSAASSTTPRHKLGQKIQVQVLEVFNEGDVTRVLLQAVMKVESQSGLLSSALEIKRTIKNAVDPRLTSLDDIKVGMTVEGKIQSIKKSQLNIRLGDNLRGRVHISELYNTIEEISDLRRPLKQFVTGETVNCRVVGMMNLKTHAVLAVTHTRANSQVGVEMSMRLVEEKEGLPELGEKLRAGIDLIRLGFIHIIEDDVVWVQLSSSLLGRIDVLQMSPDVEVTRNIRENFCEGQAIQCRVVSVDEEKRRLDLTLLTSGAITVGSTVNCRISSISEENGLSVHLGIPNIYGRICLVELDSEQNLIERGSSLENYKEGEYLTAMVMKIDGKKVELSVRACLVESECLPKNTISNLLDGQVVSGFVQSITENGIYVSLGFDLNARVKIAELSDSYVKEWKSLFKKGDQVKGRISELSIDKNQVEMTLKGSSFENRHGLSHSDIKPNMVMSGKISKIAAFGIFIELKDTRSISGLCHISEVEKIGDFQVGDLVKVFVLRIDAVKKKVSLSLKSAHFDSISEEISDEELTEESDDAISVEDLKPDQIESNDVEITESESEIDAEEDTHIARPEALALTEQFSWNDESTISMNPIQDSSSESDANSASDADIKKSSSRRAKKSENIQKEKLIAKREIDLLEDKRNPEVSEDYERLLLSEPNNSFLWIKYMAFQLELAEPGKARLIAKRAIDVISFRDEQERLNIFVASLNLELKYGSQEDVLEVFGRACQMVDPKKVHLQLASIYSKNLQLGLAEDILKKTIKKFKQSCKVWKEYCLFLVQNARADEAHEVLKRSLQSLVPRKHMKMMVAFGQIEFKNGEIERGRTVFEGMVGKYPKKADLWSIYIDMELRSSADPTGIRLLLQRVLALKWSTKKMKFFFKRALDVEKKLGTPEGEIKIKEQAKVWVMAQIK